VELPETLIDTCCLLNLCAVGDPYDLLPQIPFQWRIARAVLAEELSIRPRPDAKKSERQRIDLTRCLDGRVIVVCEPQDDEERALYVSLAMEVDDGEAMSLAIARVRKWGVATDDGAARRVATRIGVATVTTPQLTRCWAERTKADSIAIATALRRIETLARYAPTPETHDFEWWSRHRETK
jgi:predicted nucleic acid-binding protein